MINQSENKMPSFLFYAIPILDYVGCFLISYYVMGNFLDSLFIKTLLSVPLSRIISNWVILPIIAIVLSIMESMPVSSKKQKRPKIAALKTDYQKYLSEIEEILNHEKQVVDLVRFELVSDYVLSLAKSDPQKFEKMIKDGRPVQNWVYSVMGNHLADLIETGKFHTYRGILNGPGQAMMERFDRYADKLVHLGDFSEREAMNIKRSMRDVIKQAG